MGSGSVTGVDHLVIKVRDLDRAREVYGRLGFTLTPPARHPGLGTANHTAVFEDRTYIEFLAIEEPDNVGSPFAPLRDAREGVGALALRTNDARELHHRLNADGKNPGAPVSFGRPVDLPDGPAEARFTATPLAAGSLPGGAAFACEQHTPDFVWQNGYLSHENGAVGIAALVIVSDTPEETAHTCAALFRTEARPGVSGTWAVAAGAVEILVGKPALLRWAWSADPLLGETGPLLGGVVIRVEDLHRAQQSLQKSRMPIICSGGVLRVTSQHTLGVMLAFTVEFDPAMLLP